jgi:hypothetical protein
MLTLDAKVNIAAGLESGSVAAQSLHAAATGLSALDDRSL